MYRWQLYTEAPNFDGRFNNFFFEVFKRFPHEKRFLSTFSILRVRCKKVKNGQKVKSMWILHLRPKNVLNLTNHFWDLLMVLILTVFLWSLQNFVNFQLISVLCLQITVLRIVRVQSQAPQSLCYGQDNWQAEQHELARFCTDDCNNLFVVEPLLCKGDDALSLIVNKSRWDKERPLYASLNVRAKGEF